MNIHPLWFICILIRSLIIIFTRKILKSNIINNILHSIITLILLTMGIGFAYKACTGSNNEYQINKVFWHNTRYIHSILYILSAITFYNKNIKMNTLFLTLDLLFSITYRIITNQ